MKLLLPLTLCWSLLVPAVVCGAETPTLQFWIYEPYDPSSAEEVLQPFFKEFGRRHRLEATITASTDFENILARCQTENAVQIVAIPLPLLPRLEKACDYQTMAITMQEAFLYRKNLSSNLSLKDIKRVGLIDNTQATGIAFNEFPTEEKINFFFYPSALELLAGVKKDKLEATVAPKGLFERTAARNFGWTPMYRFKSRDVILLMVSPSLDTKTAFAFESLIFSDNDLVVHAWQQRLGLGLFQRPERVSEKKLQIFTINRHDTNN